MRASTKKKARFEEDFPHLESALGTALRPVSPRSDFINGLRSRLISESKNTRPGLSNFQFFLLMMVGVATSILVILQGTRMIIGIISAVSLLRVVGNQVRQKNAQMISEEAKKGVA